jgi:exodeoxyribonuclease III
MKLATWNVNSLQARLPRVLELVELHRPDVLLMQETKTEPNAFPMLELEAAGYRAVHHSAGRWAGVALLARGEIDGVRAGLTGEPSRGEARWLEADVDGMRVVSVQVPGGRSPDSPFYEEKLCFLDAMAERVATLAGGGPLVVAGDMGVCATDLDVYDPTAFVGATHVTQPERERFQRLLDTGLVDAFRSLHPHDPGFTWWDRRQAHFRRRKGLRIDVVLLSPQVARELIECGIDRSFRMGSNPSDHAPLICTLAR